MTINLNFNIYPNFISVLKFNMHAGRTVLRDCMKR